MMDTRRNSIFLGFLCLSFALHAVAILFSLFSTSLWPLGSTSRSRFESSEFEFLVIVSQKKQTVQATAPREKLFPAKSEVRTGRAAVGIGEKGERGEKRENTPESRSLALKNYASAVARELDRAKVYPADARERGESGRVVLLLELEPQGLLKRVQVLEPSVYESLNQAAQETARKVAQFPEFPRSEGEPSLGIGIIALKVPMEYSLVSDGLPRTD